MSVAFSFPKWFCAQSRDNKRTSNAHSEYDTLFSALSGLTLGGSSVISSVDSGSVSPILYQRGDPFSHPSAERKGKESQMTKGMNGAAGSEAFAQSHPPFSFRQRSNCTLRITPLTSRQAPPERVWAEANVARRRCSRYGDPD